MDDSQCLVKSVIVLTAQTSYYVPIECNNIDKFTSNSLLFEPTMPFPTGCLIARSCQLRTADQLYCNIVNASDEAISLKQDQIVGNLCNIETANENFDKKVQDYVQLDVRKLVHNTGKTCSSVPIANKTPKPPELSTNDILQHQTRRDISVLKIGKHLTQIQRELLVKVLLRNQSAFLWNAKEIGHTDLIEHVIPTGNNRPIHTKQYPIPSVARERVQEQVDEMLENKLIRPSYSPWCSPVLLAKKKLLDGTVRYRFCVDLK